MSSERDKIEYLKNELRSYNEIKRRVENDESCYDSRIRFYENKLKDVANELAAGNAKGIDYGYVPTTAVREPLLQLLATEEKLKANLDYFVNMKEAEIKGFRIRIEYMDNMLAKLDDSEREFITEYYINHVRIDKLEITLNRSRGQLFRDKENLIKKMLDL